MAIIPGTAKVLNQYENVNTTYGGSKAMKAQSKWYTMDDVLETVEANIPGGGVTEIIAGDGISVDEGTGVVTITNTVEPYVAPYKVFTALVKQENAGSPGSIGPGSSLLVGRTYKIDDADGDFTNVGAPNNDTGTSFIATGTTPAVWDNGLLSYNEGAPTATVLENTIGNIWFEYSGEGNYYIISDSQFTLDKTFINGTPLTGYSVLNNFVEASGSDAGRGYFLLQLDTQFIQLNTIRGYATFRDDVLLYPTCIEIRVYN
jgi:hypothetical protein